MKKKFQFLAFILMVTLLQACLPEDQLTPDNVDVRDKYRGTWLFNDNLAKSSPNVVYTVSITLDPSNSSQVRLAHFGGYSGSETAYGVATSGGITIPNQLMATDFSLENCSGSLVNANTMDWRYTIVAGANRDTYHAIATRQ